MFSVDGGMSFNVPQILSSFLYDISGVPQRIQKQGNYFSACMSVSAKNLKKNEAIAENHFHILNTAKSCLKYSLGFCVDNFKYRKERQLVYDGMDGMGKAMTHVPKFGVFGVRGHLFFKRKSSIFKVSR